jgi:hypothetical protein
MNDSSTITIIGDGKLVLDANPGKYDEGSFARFRFFFFISGNLTLRGITFVNGSPGRGPIWRGQTVGQTGGGAIYVGTPDGGGGGGVLTIDDCIFANNSASGAYNRHIQYGAAGGAIYFEGPFNDCPFPCPHGNMRVSRLVVTNSTFENNHAIISPGESSGGAIAIIAARVDSLGVDVTITGCFFRNNTVCDNHRRGDGGAIHFTVPLDDDLPNGRGAGRLTINASTFINNNGNFGGALNVVMYPGGNSASFINIIGSIFVNNFAYGVGHAVSTQLANGTVTVCNSTFVNHGDTSHGDSTYAFFAQQAGTLNFTNSNFTNNTGGALFLSTDVYQMASGYEAGLLVTGCVFEDNVAECGGAIQLIQTNTYSYISSSSFTKPINASAGHNDIASNKGVIFHCPEGTTGKDVTVLPSTPPGSKCPAIDAADLPPSKKVTHCNPSKYVCHRPGTAPGQCVETPTGGVSHKDCIEVCN